jgi:hypothetical protein
MNTIEKNILMEIADLHEIPEGAYNIRRNGALESRNTTAKVFPLPASMAGNSCGSAGFFISQIISLFPVFLRCFHI